MSGLPIDVARDELADFCRRNRIRTLALFGSVLRPDFGPHSDVDVLVDFELGVRVGFMDLGRMQRELSRLLNRPVDLVPRGGLKPIIREIVVSSSEVLYAA